MSNDRENIVARIKKLLALADNKGATEAEAAAAALAAQRLIAQYDVEQWEIHSKDAEPIEEVLTNHTPRKWRWQLANVVAPAFRCKYYQQSDWDEDGLYRTKKIVFFGYKTDATAAAITFNTLYKIGNRLASRFSRDAERGSYNAYVLGFVRGISLELEKQTEALMIVTPPKVNEAFREMTDDMSEAKNTVLDVGTGYDSCAAYQEGIEEGRAAVQSHRFDYTDAEQPEQARAALCA